MCMWLACCFWEVLGCQYRSQSVDQRYGAINVSECAHAYVHKHVGVCLMPSCHISTSWQAYFLIGAVCLTLRWRGQAATGHQGNVMNLLWDAEESQRDGVACGCLVTRLHKPVIGLEWILHLYVLFLEKTLITESAACLTVGLYDSTLSEPVSSFLRQPCLFSFPSVPYPPVYIWWLSFKE